jgi:hypothetical protein
MCILAELNTQRKALLKKGEDVPSHMVEPSFEELMAGRVQPSPDETPEEKEKRISAFWFMVEFLAPKVWGTKGWEADMCSILLQQTNFTASDETMTKLALENMWRQWQAAPAMQEVWKQRREAGIHGRVPTRKEWDGCRMVLISTMNCSRKQS